MKTLARALRALEPHAKARSLREQKVPYMLTIRQKTTLGSSIIVAVILLTMLIAGYGVNRIRLGGPLVVRNENINNFIADILPPAEYVIEPYLEVTQLVANPAELSTRRARLQKLEKDYNDGAYNWQKNDQVDSAIRQQQATTSGASAHQFWQEVDTVLLPAISKGDQATTKASYARVSAMYQTHRQQIDALVTAAQKSNDDIVANGNSTMLTVVSFMAFMALLIPAMVVGGVIGFRRMAVDPLALIISEVEAVAMGDLTRDVSTTRTDEIGEVMARLHAMTTSLRDVVAQTAQVAENVTAGSRQLSYTATVMSQGSTEQASATEEASASMEEIAANIKQNADNAAQTERIVQQSSRDAETSGQAVQNAVNAMRTIADKIGIVQEIARQTDLLALNAAVEAARAGEYGKGFAVVASEVRKLAERSQAAAADISAVSANTVSAAIEAGEMLTRLVPDIRRTAELVSEISAACREQDIGARQINQAIQQLDAVTQQNSAASEQISTTSEELADKSEQLQQSIAYFQVGADNAPGAKAINAPQSFKDRASAKLTRAKPVSKGVAIGRQKPRSHGFALHLTQGGRDDDDMQFASPVSTYRSDMGL